MKSKLLLPTLALTIGIIGGICLNSKFRKPKSSDIAKFEEIVRIKELHLIKHIYQDLSFIHRKNDASKSLKAVALVPVSVTAYIDLTQMIIKHKNDSIIKIILPYPEMSEPNYLIEKMEVKKVKGFQIHIGKDLHAEVLSYLTEIVTRRKKAIVQLSVENGIVEETKKGAEEYITSLLRGLNIEHVELVFETEAPIEDQAKMAVMEGVETYPVCPQDMGLAYLPEFIGVVNLKE